jgi:general secretion pathway protein H
MTRQGGFTLIELLVVIVLLGLLTSIAVGVAGGGSQQRELQNEVARLHAVLNMAMDEAILSNNEIGAIVDSEGYEFVVYNEESVAWEAAAQDFLSTYPFPDWLVSDFRREGDTNRDLPTQDQSAATNDADDNAKIPDLMLFSSGEITQFRIGLEIDGDPDSRLEILVDENDAIVLPHLQQDEDA